MHKYSVNGLVNSFHDLQFSHDLSNPSRRIPKQQNEDHVIFLISPFRILPDSGQSNNNVAKAVGKTPQLYILVQAISINSFALKYHKLYRSQKKCPSFTPRSG